MSITRHHNEWLSLVPNSGPFLSLPVLAQAFPQGLDAHEPEHARRLRLAFDEWDDDQLGKRPDPGIHRAWVKFVLGETLGYEELLAEGQEIPQTLKSDVAEYGETLRPDWIVNDPATKKVRLLVQSYPRPQSLTKPVASSRWKTSPDTRMMQLLHDTGIRLGIVTNGDHWMLVNAPKNETTGYVSWYANLWLEEQITLRAFRTILGADRLFSVPPDQTLEALLDKSAADQQLVTDQLGYQVRKAVEVLIQSLDKADQDHGRKLLAGVEERVLYESALTVMMRLVFLFCAEERELLLLGDELYDKNYAVSTLREQLEVAKSEHTEEILGLRYDAWPRLLTAFRAVYAGVKHDRLKLPAYGGSLFNPDRFPFLEGRSLGTSWKDTEAAPLPVNNRTVLHLLDSLQSLETKMPGQKEVARRKLSFRSLDIEQIGHVYEGLLDHTAKRATEPVLGLAGTRDKEPEIALAELERFAAKGEKELVKFLKDETGRSESALKKALNAEIDDQLASRFRTACQDSDLWKRVKPFAGLVRLDTVGYPVVITPGSVFVTAGTDRRSSGTHYTPKSLTEPIVQYTLEPLVYVGPAEGLPKDQWRLKAARELLDLKICDMACGSGAFLVQACRYIAARLQEAWEQSESVAQPGHQAQLFAAQPKTAKSMVRIAPYGLASVGGMYEQLVPLDADERQTYALRIVAQRCLYGVDKNPLACEMAKLSLWLLTLAKDKPFEFLDHAIRCGDSLVGIHNLDQLNYFDLDNKPGQTRIITEAVQNLIKKVVTLRRQITEMQANTVEDVEAQDRMLREANAKIDRLKCAADMLISAEFATGSAADKRSARDDAAISVAVHFNDSDLATFRQEAQKALAGQVTFHWPLEFPEVMVERGGFDAFMGNPPFLGGKRIGAVYGEDFSLFLKGSISRSKGAADLCAYFFRRASMLLRLHGTTGLVATNTIAQADTREVGLDVILSEGATIFRAESKIVWPGAANVHASVVHWTKGEWKATAILDGGECAVVGAHLVADTSITTKPFCLTTFADLATNGTQLSGIGFVIDADEARDWIRQDPRYGTVLFPYINGKEVNDTFDFIPQRFCIDFGEWPESKAAEYPLAIERVRKLVRPSRERLTGQIHETCYWKHWDKRPTLYEAIRPLKRVLVCSLVSKHLPFVFVPSGWTYSKELAVFPTDKAEHFSVLQSNFHQAWVRLLSSTMKSDLSYSIGDGFRTFPCPQLCLKELHHLGETYHALRTTTLLSHREGLTKTYNRFHNPDETSADIQKLRHLHVEMDNAVAAAYGWIDLDLGHGFHETKQGVRYTISELALREVLARLLKLNHERYAEEVKQGLHKKKKSTSRKKTAKADDGGGLFRGE